MKSSDSNRFSQLDQSKYSSSVAKKRKFGDSESCAGDSSSAEGDHSWDFSDEHDSDGEGSYPSGNYSIVDYPPSRPLFSASSLTDGRQFSSRFVKSEDPSLSNSNRGIPKSHLNDIPRKYVNDKSATPRYNPSGTSHTASSQAAEATPLSRSLTGSSSNSSKATKYKGSICEVLI